jgi:hypothetical protein
MAYPHRKTQGEFHAHRIILTQTTGEKRAGTLAAEPLSLLVSDIYGMPHAAHEGIIPALHPARKLPSGIDFRHAHLPGRSVLRVILLSFRRLFDLS